MRKALKRSNSNSFDLACESIRRDKGANVSHRRKLLKKKVLGWYSQRYADTLHIRSVHADRPLWIIIFTLIRTSCVLVILPPKFERPRPSLNLPIWTG
ncbi:hypothetical protein EVAR_25858_1 [Eumeta japonica]|uniref:Uncharacterized protein n=1 Tax=Eumeta variegata TaxID=151549 RepID=A0A4C1X950_EUMVA|nr:hypothetical protein EVAR_25858_1 [Eumeta japonica]